MRAILGLEDGTWFEGRSFTGPGEASGEVIFNTGMSGYQEVLTDPSYCRQLVCMTYPHMGNYGINPEDIESSRIQVSGFIVKECCRQPSNFRSTISLPDYLSQQGVLGMEGLDTRALTRHIRLQGAMRGVISTSGEPQEVVAKAREIPEMEGSNLIPHVEPQKPYLWTDQGPQPVDLSPGSSVWTGSGPRVLVLDYGAKWNILRHLRNRGAQVLAVPGSWTAEQVKGCEPEAIFLSNGPGDPAALDSIIHHCAMLMDDYPTGGICLGHQIIGLALGATSFKLKFGHHGLNHPVKDLSTGHIEISSQNHGFCVDISKLDVLRQTHINLNDATLEGFRHTSRPIMAVQYHPEAAPGPHDSNSFFDAFMRMVQGQS